MVDNVSESIRKVFSKIFKIFCYCNFNTIAITCIILEYIIISLEKNHFCLLYLSNQLASINNS